MPCCSRLARGGDMRFWASSPVKEHPAWHRHSSAPRAKAARRFPSKGFMGSSFPSVDILVPSIAHSQKKIIIKL